MNFLETRLLKKQTVIEQGVDDTVVGIRIRHTDSCAVTSVTVSQGSDNLVLIDADGTTTIDFTAGATDTLGEVADTINAATNWECIILDAKRDDDVNTTDIFIDGAITASTYDGVSYYDVKMDTSNYDAMSKRLIYSRHTEGGGKGKLDEGHRVKLKEVTYNLTLGGGADANALRIYDVEGSTETEIWRSTPVDATSTDLFSKALLYGDQGITVKPGNNILVKISDGTSVTGSMHIIGELE